MIKRFKYKPLPEVPPPKYAWYWEPFEWEWEEEEMPRLIDAAGDEQAKGARDMMIIEPKCPYCGKQMAYVSKHLDIIDPLGPQCVIGFRCYSEKCGFIVSTPCKVDEQKEAVDFLLNVIEEEKER